ncbi:MAG: hypothetical protein ABIJ97_10180 [Bacteroidota bacterium]
MKNTLMSIAFALTLFSCAPKTVNKDGGIIIELIYDSNDTTKITEIISSRLTFIELKDFSITSTENNSLKVEIPVFSDTSFIIDLLCSEGCLTINETFENSGIYPILETCNKMFEETFDTIIDKKDSLFKIFVPAKDHNGKPSIGPEICYAESTDTAQINIFFKEHKDLFPKDFLPKWSKEIKYDNYYVLVGLKSSENKSLITGSMISSAKIDENNGNTVSFSFKPEFNETWANATRNNINRSLAIIIDDQLYSYPTVMQEIAGGDASITGNFDLNEVKILAAILNSGKLPCRLTVKNVEIIKTR